MRHSPRNLVAAALVLSAATTPAATATAAPEKAPVTVTNTQAQRTAYCTVLLDGIAYTQISIGPGKAWTGSFDPRSEVRLVCERSTERSFGPLKTGSTYRLVDTGKAKISLAEGAGG